MKLINCWWPKSIFSLKKQDNRWSLDLYPPTLSTSLSQEKIVWICPYGIQYSQTPRGDLFTRMDRPRYTKSFSMRRLCLSSSLESPTSMTHDNNWFSFKIWFYIFGTETNWRLWCNRLRLLCNKLYSCKSTCQKWQLLFNWLFKNFHFVILSMFKNVLKFSE